MTARFLVAAVAAGAVMAGASRPLYVYADQAKPAAGPARLVVVTATDPVGEKMSYGLSTIRAKPGERIRLRLSSMGQLPRTVMTHNWVLLAAGADPKKFAEAAALTPATGYIPKALKSQILAMTEMVGPGEQAEVIVTVPTTPGTYPYLAPSLVTSWPAWPGRSSSSKGRGSEAAVSFGSPWSAWRSMEAEPCGRLRRPGEAGPPGSAFCPRCLHGPRWHSMVRSPTSHFPAQSPGETARRSRDGRADGGRPRIARARRSRCRTTCRHRPAAGTRS